ncbi:MAG: sortase, partial [Ignavibacteriae bacterium]|nr:sortase [Ignavibacteriota bacterium]
MSLKKYTKAPAQKKRGFTNRPYKTKLILEIQQEPLTIWRLLSGIKNDIRELLTTSKLAGTLIPAIFIIYGFNLLLGQIIPSASDYLQSKNGGIEQGIVPIVPNDFVLAKQEFLSKPGSAYFVEIQNNAMRARILEPDPVSNSYKGTFKLSIPNLNLKNLNVTANTNSGVETVYDQVLANGLAHMESTGLPISDTNNNIVIYGHSAGGGYYQRTHDPAAAFSELTGIKLGDEVTITINGETYNYKVIKTRIVEPTALDI